MDGFSEFLQFSMKLVEAGRVFEAGTIMVDPRDSVGSFDSKTARERALFSCSELVAGCGEVATVEMVGGRKMMSSGLGKLIRTRVASFEGPMMLGEGVLVVILVIMGSFSKISTFVVKSVGF